MNPIPTPLIKRVTLAVFLTGASLSAADSVTNLTDELISLRAEVEALHADLDDEKEAIKSRMKSLAMQKSELEANIRREETRIKQIESGIAKIKETIAQNSSGSQALIPIVITAAESMEAIVQTSLPFKKSDRLEALKGIKSDLQSGLITPEKAANKLWAFYEDEIRLTKENGLFRQSLTIDGEERLVDVARVGMVALYFKSGDGQMGYAKKEATGWVITTTESSSDREQIEGLFDAFKKQIRTGFFTLPNTLPKMEIN